MTAGRGELRVYLGAAPGVGKTFAMLNEGGRRKARGTDVVVGFAETYGRQDTAAQLGDLEVVPRVPMEYCGAVFEEMNIGAILQRRSEVASSTSWPTPTFPAAATRSGGRTSRNCSRPASPSSRP